MTRTKTQQRAEDTLPPGVIYFLFLLSHDPPMHPSLQLGPRNLILKNLEIELVGIQCSRQDTILSRKLHMIDQGLVSKDTKS